MLVMYQEPISEGPTTFVRGKQSFPWFRLPAILLFPALAYLTYCVFLAFFAWLYVTKPGEEFRLATQAVALAFILLALTIVLGFLYSLLSLADLVCGNYCYLWTVLIVSLYDLFGILACAFLYLTKNIYRKEIYIGLAHFFAIILLGMGIITLIFYFLVYKDYRKIADSAHALTSLPKSQPPIYYSSLQAPALHLPNSNNYLAALGIILSFIAIVLCAVYIYMFINAAIWIFSAKPPAIIGYLAITDAALIVWLTISSIISFIDSIFSIFGLIGCNTCLLWNYILQICLPLAGAVGFWLLALIVSDNDWSKWYSMCGNILLIEAVVAGVVTAIFYLFVYLPNKKEKVEPEQCLE